MRNVDVFADVPDCETDVWTRIAKAATKLDKQDFLDSSLADYEEFNPSVSQPDLRVGTQSVTKASPSERSGKRSTDDDESMMWTWQGMSQSNFIISMKLVLRTK